MRLHVFGCDIVGVVGVFDARIDRTPTHIVVTAPTVPTPATTPLVHLPDGTVVLKGPVSDEVEDGVTLSSAVSIADDVAPSQWFSTCWSSNPFGTCDVGAAVTEGGSADGAVNTASIPVLSTTTALDLWDPVLRSALDGLSVCAFAFVRSVVEERNLGKASPCVTLDFSPPSAGVVIDGSYVFMDEAFFASPFVAVSWDGALSLLSNTGLAS
jgi:hypothetical protein